MYRQKITKGQHRMKIREVSRSALQLWREAISRVVDDPHVKAARSLSHGLPNTPHAKDTKCFAGDTHSKKVALADTISPALAHDPVIFKSTPSSGKQHHKRMISRAFRQNARSIRHNQATLSRGGNIDMIEADTTCRSNSDRGWQSRDEVRVQWQCVREHDRVGKMSGRGFGDFIRGHVIVAIDNERVKLLTCANIDVRWHQARENKAWLHIAVPLQPVAY